MTFEIEKYLDARSQELRLSMREFGKLFVQQWPAPPQILVDAHKEFGTERAEELRRRAERESYTTARSFEDCLTDLVWKERYHSRQPYTQHPRCRCVLAPLITIGIDPAKPPLRPEDESVHNAIAAMSNVAANRRANEP